MSGAGGDERRTLGFWSLLSLGINGIVGVGIFFAPREVAALVPGATGIWVYALTALALLPVASAYALLGGHFDEDGGPYIWARAAFGPGFGFAVGWIAYVSALFSTAAVVAGLATHAAPLAGIASGWGIKLAALGAVVVLAGVASTGLSPSAITWSAITVLKLSPLLIVAAAFAIGSASVGPPKTAAAAAVGGGELTRAALVVVFAMQGFEIVPVPAGHARGSARSIPAATLIALLTAALLYVALHAACVATIPDLKDAPAPLAAAAHALGGPVLGTTVAFGTNVSALGIAFGMFAMTPRYLAAIGNRQGLGPWLGTEDARRVPQRALWATAAVVAALVLAGELTELFALSSVAVLAQYAVSIAALGVLALRRERGLKAAHIWPVPFALGTIALLVQAARWRELVVAGVVLMVGGLLLLARRWVTRRAASG